MDAGATAAFAVLDARGKLIALHSIRGGGEGKLIEAISEFKPKMIACDTKNPSKIVLRLKAAFHARLFTPKHSLTEVEKEFMTRAYECGNVHERDALAAALKAFNVKASNKLRQARKYLHLSEEDDEVLKEVFEGRKMSELK